MESRKGSGGRKQGNGGREGRGRESEKIRAWQRERGSREEERKGEGERGEIGKEVRSLKLAFWNIAGIKNKDKGFWEEIKEWDVMILMETWLDNEGWKKLRK